MSLEKAHYKISGLPAWIAGFTDRGILREGFAADIIVYGQGKLRRRRIFGQRDKLKADRSKGA
jgi:N-acyl-D-aspartate/D-glutamate deacylase